jgi:uncharacterized spore protein YtfJ
MAEENHHALEITGRAHERAATVLAELISVASADKVYSQPVVAGDRTIITAAEIHTGMGFGYGLSTGVTVPSRWRKRERSDGGPGGGGGGGGGQALGRPVAVVTIDPEGVTVQPVLDRTKIVVTALTSLGAIGLMLIKMRRASRRLALGRWHGPD